MEFILSTFDGIFRTHFDGQRFSLVAKRKFRKVLTYGLVAAGNELIIAQRTSFTFKGRSRNWLATMDRGSLSPRVRMRLRGDEDVHEIGRVRGGVLIPSARYPYLFWARGNALQPVDITPFLPSSFAEGAPGPNHRYHLNSLLVEGTDVLLLAHNWTFPSFILSMRTRVRGRKLEMEQIERLDAVGRQCHSLLKAGGKLLTLSGSEQALAVISEGNRVVHNLPPWPEELFPRGLLRVGNKIIVGAGIAKDVRSQRHGSDTVLAIFCLDKQRFVGIQKLGEFGNTCAMLEI